MSSMKRLGSHGSGVDDHGRLWRDNERLMCTVMKVYRALIRSGTTVRVDYMWVLCGLHKILDGLVLMVVVVYR